MLVYVMDIIFHPWADADETDLTYIKGEIFINQKDLSLNNINPQTLT